MTGNLAMGANKITDLATATADTDAVPISQLGDWRLLATKTCATSASISFTSADYDFSLDTYDDYKIEISNVKPNQDDYPWFLNIGTGATPTWQSVRELYASQGKIVGSALAAAFTSSSGYIVAASATWGLTYQPGNAAGESYSATLYFSNPDSGDIMPISVDAHYMRAAGTAVRYVGCTTWTTGGAAITGFLFQPGAGHFVTGKFRLYGLKK